MRWEVKDLRCSSAYVCNPESDTDSVSVSRHRGMQKIASELSVKPVIVVKTVEGELVKSSIIEEKVRETGPWSGDHA